MSSDRRDLVVTEAAECQKTNKWKMAQGIFMKVPHSPENKPTIKNEPNLLLKT